MTLVRKKSLQSEKPRDKTSKKDGGAHLRTSLKKQCRGVLLKTHGGVIAGQQRSKGSNAKQTSQKRKKQR